MHAEFRHEGSIRYVKRLREGPPGLPVPVNGMLLNLRVRDVGTFNYDAANWFSALSPVGQCS
jgi:hypothetical protein